MSDWNIEARCDSDHHRRVEYHNNIVDEHGRKNKSASPECGWRHELDTCIDEAEADGVDEPPGCAARIVQNNGCNANDVAQDVVELDSGLVVAYAAMDIASEDPMLLEGGPE
jgi:hypothetical protein